MSKVSVIVPVFNVEHYIGRCMHSLVNQTYKNIEIVIVIDKKIDQSMSILKEYLDNYPNLFVLVDQDNKGVSVARNVGIEASTGDFILFLDSDDYLEDDAIEQLIEVAKNDNADIVHFNYKTVDDYEEVINEPFLELRDYNGEIYYKEIVKNKVIYDERITFFFRKSYWDLLNYKFQEGMYNILYDLAPLSILKAKTVSSISKPLYNKYKVEEDFDKPKIYFKDYKTCQDALIQYDELVNFSSSIKDKETRKVMLGYIAYKLFVLATKLRKNDLKEYIKELKRRKVSHNIRIYSFKDIFKKLNISMSPSKYVTKITK